MTGNSPLTGEVSNSKVAAIFYDERAARAVAVHLQAAMHLTDAQVEVITPGDPGPGRKLEPESEGIFRTIVRTHVVLGLAGAVAGALAFAVLWWMAIPMIVNSAAMAAAVIVVFGIVAGLMLGGLVSLRPDHDRYISRVMEAVGEGRSAVVVHAFSREQNTQAAGMLRAASGEVVATL